MVSKSKLLCLGCENNFYNGNNDMGVKECWDYETAEITLRKKVCASTPPPWDWPPEEMLTCYRKKHFVIFEGDRRKW